MKRRHTEEKLRLLVECPCGYRQEVVWGVRGNAQITPGYVSEVGTDFPTELLLVCPDCGGEKVVLG